MRKICLFLTLFCVALFSSVAVADDFYPADFRGQPLSVEAHWDFALAPMDFLNIPPDTFHSVGGNNEEILFDGFLTNLGTSTIDWDWFEDPIDTIDGGITSIIGNGGEIILSMQNWLDQMPYKDIRIQVTSWWLNGFDQQPSFLPITVLGQPFDDWILVDSGYIPAGQGLDPTKDYSWVDIRMIPNPDWEKIIISVPDGLVIDQIDIDTISIPEPLTLSLVGFGALLAMRKKS